MINYSIFYALLLLMAGFCVTSSASDKSLSAELASPFGVNDTLGAINVLGADDVLRAIKTVSQGQVHSLALATTVDTPAYDDRSYAITVTASDQPAGSNQATGLDDKVHSHMGIGTQIDGLGHVGINFVHYNGIHLDEFFTEHGITKFAVSDIPPIATRGVLLDMARYFSVDVVPAGTAFNKQVITRALQQQGILLQAGDVVIFHSNWNTLLKTDPEAWLLSHPGLSEEGADYLAAQGVVAIGSDTAALEVMPHQKPDTVMPVHQLLLVKHGVYIIEGLNTAQLAEQQVSEFMFVLGVPKLQGAVQAIVHPVAIY